MRSISNPRQTPFERGKVEAAAAALKTQAYVSETDIEDTHWYRLRVGPVRDARGSRARAANRAGALIRAPGSRSTMSKPI